MTTMTDTEYQRIRAERRAEFERTFPSQYCLWCSDFALRYTSCLRPVAQAYLAAVARCADSAEAWAAYMDAAQALDAALYEFGREREQALAAGAIITNHP